MKTLIKRSLIKTLNSDHRKIYNFYISINTSNKIKRLGIQKRLLHKWFEKGWIAFYISKETLTIFFLKARAIIENKTHNEYKQLAEQMQTVNKPIKWGEWKKFNGTNPNWGPLGNIHTFKELRVHCNWVRVALLHGQKGCIPESPGFEMQPGHRLPGTCPGPGTSVAQLQPGDAPTHGQP